MSLAVARALPPDERGWLAVMLTAATLLQVAAFRGLPSATAFFIASDPEGTDTTKRLAYRASMASSALGLAMMAALSIALVAFGDAPPLPLAFLAIWIGAGAFVTFAHSLRQGFGDFAAAAKYRAAIMVAPNLAAAAIAVSTQSLSGIAAGYAATTTLIAVVALLELRSGTRRIACGGILAPESVRRFRRYGRGALVSTLAWTLNGRLDVLIVGYLFTAGDAGTYAVALSIGQLALPIFIAISFTGFQRVAIQRELGSVSRVIVRHMRLAGAVAAVLAIAGAAAARPLVTGVFGHKYADATGAARYLIPGICISGIGLVANELLRGLGRPFRSMVGDICGVSTLATVVVLLRPESIVGVARCACLAYVTVAVVSIVGLHHAVRERSLAPSPSSDQVEGRVL